MAFSNWFPVDAVTTNITHNTLCVSYYGSPGCSKYIKNTFFLICPNCCSFLSQTWVHYFLFYYLRPFWNHFEVVNKKSLINLFLKIHTWSLKNLSCYLSQWTSQCQKLNIWWLTDSAVSRKQGHHLSVLLTVCVPQGRSFVLHLAAHLDSCNYSPLAYVICSFCNIWCVSMYWAQAQASHPSMYAISHYRDNKRLLPRWPPQSE